MKIAFIGTYPPRECGIATFSYNLFENMFSNTNGSKDNDSFIVAMNDHEKTYQYPKEVKFTIRQEHQRDYMRAAKFINMSGANLCILEHEFGIYGGENGIYILPLLHKLNIPIIITLHTVIKSPSYNQKEVVKGICKMCSKVVVMSKKAIYFLRSIYEIPADKIAFIEHGVPDLQFNQERTKQEFNIENRKVILTFGFLGRNKGIETVINALPSVVSKYPEVLYIVLGKTHPNVLRYSGEEYRNYLLRLRKTLNLENNIYMMNEFVEQSELFKYLYASDIYVTPYLNEAQITSGTLSYAVGVGTAVVSTPYWHAQELLDEGRGRLFDFNDTKGLTKILLELLDDDEKRKKLRETAYKYGREITWPKIGEKYIDLSKTVVENKSLKPISKKVIIDPLLLPPFSLNHIKRLTDDTGIIQHANFGIPNLKEGYCLDDNARALLMVLMSYRQKKDVSSLELLPVYLSYIHYMQNKDGTFKNFLSFSRQFLDEVGSEDSFGRAVWALGYLLGNAPNDAYYQSGKVIFFNASANFEKIASIRSIANIMIGISFYLKKNESDDGMIERLRNLSYKLIHHYEKESSTAWKWFESLLTYDNGILPLALLHASEILNDKRVTEVALESMNFLTEITFKDGYLSLIGNKNWFKHKEERSVFAQQPIDTMSMVLMFYQAFLVTKDKIYLEKLFSSFMWFLGENDLRINMYDFETKGCCDGLEKYGLNRNQGAESTLAYLISHLTVLNAFEEYYKIDLELW